MTETLIHEFPAKHIEWKIPNSIKSGASRDPFIYCRILKSPSFHFPNTSQKWHLYIFPYVKIFSGDLIFILGLSKERSAAEHRVVFRIGIKDHNGSTLKAFEEDMVFKIGQMSWVEKITDQSTLLNPRNTLSFADVDTVFCTVTILDGPPASYSNDIATWILPAVPRDLTAVSETLFDGNLILFEDFYNMYKSRLFTDVTIFVKDEKFYAHRNILSARSSVFESMFHNEFTEKSSGEVYITDCDPVSFEKFLLFLYTGKLDNLLCSNAVDFYRIADKYNVKQLMEKCIFVMTKNMCVDSFCDVIKLATMHAEPQLLKTAKEFFNENLDVILPTPKWQQLVTSENVSLINELIMAVAKSKGKM